MYKRKYPRGCTPFVCACERGRMDHVKLFVKLHPFHKYVAHTCYWSGDKYMTLKTMVKQEGKNREHYSTALTAAAGGEHLNIVQYLIQEFEADPTYMDRSGWTTLQYAVQLNKKSTETIKALLAIPSVLNGINQLCGDHTPLDIVYKRSNRNCPIKQEIIALLRSNGGIARLHDENGNFHGGVDSSDSDESDDEYNWY